MADRVNRDTPPPMFKHGFKNVERVVRTETGSASALDDAEETNCLSRHENT